MARRSARKSARTSARTSLRRAWPGSGLLLFARDRIESPRVAGPWGPLLCAALLVLGLSACERDLPAPVSADASTLDADAGTLDTAAADDAATLDADSAATPPTGLTIHEWGTLTSVQSSAGTWLAGIHHREETLPGFVHHRDIGPKGSAAAEPFEGEATTQVQTPVLFAQADTAGDVEVRLQAPTGLFSAVWPQAATTLPAKVGALAGGELRLQLHVDPKAAPPTGDVAGLWKPLREVPAAIVSAGADRERFVFWRALSSWKPPVRVLATGEDTSTTVTVHNDGDVEIPAAFWVHVHAGGGLLKVLGSVPPKGAKTSTTTPKESNPNLFSAQVSAQVSAALVQAGLNEAEAKALIASWGENYFKTPGLRILWLVPRGWVDATLPVSVTPAPQLHNRVYVGRIEALTPTIDAQTIAAVQAAGAAPTVDALKPLGHFAEARLRAVRDQLPQADKATCDALIELALQQP